MVKLKEENDGFKRNKTSFFQAIGTPSAKLLKSYIDFGLEYIESYDWKDRPTPKSHRNLLLTPIVFGNSRSVFQYIKDMKDEGIIDNVMFDSGGFQVLTGALSDKGITSLDDLQKYNEDLYNEYDWADIYIMPDHPPSLADEYEGSFKEKVNNTVEASLKFFECLKPEIQGKSAPVFHLQKDRDIDGLYEAYKPILDKSKFASYSASSLTNPGTPRRLRGGPLLILDDLQKKLSQENVDLHCLGVGSPASVFILNYLGIRTFDASTPIIGAGIGKVFFPYMGGVSCSVERDGKTNGVGREGNLTAESLKRIREATDHRCPFCEDIEPIKRETKGADVPGYIFRRFHSFCVLDDLSWQYNSFNVEKFRKLSPEQYKDFCLIYKDQQMELF